MTDKPAKPASRSFAKPAAMVSIKDAMERKRHATALYNALFKGAAPPKWNPTLEEQARIDALRIGERFAAWEAERKAGRT